MCSTDPGDTWKDGWLEEEARTCSRQAAGRGQGLGAANLGAWETLSSPSLGMGSGCPSRPCQTPGGLTGGHLAALPRDMGRPHSGLCPRAPLGRLPGCPGVAPLTRTGVSRGLRKRQPGPAQPLRTGTACVPSSTFHTPPGTGFAGEKTLRVDRVRVALFPSCSFIRRGDSSPFRPRSS